MAITSNCYALSVRWTSMISGNTFDPQQDSINRYDYQILADAAL